MKNTVKICVLLFCVFMIAVSNGNVSPRRFNFISLPNKAEASTERTGEIYTVTFEQLEKPKKYIDKSKKEEDITAFPEALSKLDGKMVKITGNLLIPGEQYYMNEPLKSFAVSKNAFGCPCCTWGPPPTVFDSIFVTMKDGMVLEPPYSQYVIVTGTFAVKKEHCSDGRLAGLFYITNATAEKVKKSFLSSIF